MGLSVNLHPQEPITAISNEFSNFVTFEVRTEDSSFTLYIHTVEDALTLLNAASEAVINTKNLKVTENVNIVDM